MTDSAPAENLLRHETSPYLLQHKDNPVHWRPWGAAALAEAKATDKPILLSVGYAACHWCHVMAHESFEDPATAERMNAQFVNVKVDREERPDIDAIYQQALAMLGEHGGWPLTMFLTPDGEPFWGGTYFPAEAKYGRPGFREVLDAIAATYRDQTERVRHNVEALREGFEKLSKPQAGAGIDTATADDCARKLLEVVDWTNGGIGRAPKFPQPSLLRQLWAAHERGVDNRCGEAVLHTLNRICEGGIYDHVGGGFARYAVDTRWLVPHFEKMLYDNAQLLPLLAKAHLATGDPLYRRRAEETVAWLLEDMQTDAGGFASARDADSEGEEGKFYVWREAEIDALLGDDAPLFKEVYDVSPDGNWEGVTILNRLALDRDLTDDEQARLDRALETLRRARAERVPPLKDDKVLADWNGMTVRGLVEAGQHLDRPDWIAAARRAFDFVAEAMADPDKGSGRLRHSFRAGEARHDGTIDDYVQMALAALALHEAIGESVYLEHAVTWADVLERHFHDTRPAAEGGGGFFFTADDAEDLITRTKTATDNATPAGNGQAVELFWRLGALTGETRYHDRAEEIVRTFAGELARNFIPLSSLIEGAVLLERGVQIVVAGPPDEPATRTLLRTVHSVPLAARVLETVRPDETLPEGHPVAGKGPVDTGDGPAPAAYVCVGPVCERPITDPDALSRRLTAG